MLHNTFIKVLIIEDDYVWRSKLQMYVEQIGLIVGACTTNVADSKLFLEKNKIDLIIADVTLKGELIFELYKNNRLFSKIPTILITKNTDESTYAAASIINKSIYLVKPIHKFTLQSAVESLLEEKIIKEIENNTVNYIEVRGTHNELVKLNFKYVIWLEQKKNYCFLKTATTTYCIRKSLKEISTILPSFFLRIHKSYFINTDYINKIANDTNTITVNENVLNIGRFYKESVKDYLSTQILRELEKY